MKWLAVVLLALVPWMALAAKDYKDRRPVLLQDLTRSKGPSSCDAGKFQCGFGECVPDEWLCDTERDCFSDADEENCPTDCSGPHQFLCRSGQCISRAYLCDGYFDCGDRSDEANCQAAECPRGEVKCDGTRCIKETWLCDGDHDCTSGWDEAHCNQSCSPNQFRCRDGSRCIDRQWTCDGRGDCADHSDEANCTCDWGEFQCGSGQCIPQDWECDGNNDCEDRSDETHCATTHPTSCRDMMSAHGCSLMNTASHPICDDDANAIKFCRKFCNLCTHS